MMRIWKVFRSPISSDQEVLCNEISLDSKFIHVSPPRSRFYGSHDRLSIFFGHGHGKIEQINFGAIVQIRLWEFREIWVKVEECITRFDDTINKGSWIEILTS